MKCWFVMTTKFKQNIYFKLLIIKYYDYENNKCISANNEEEI